MSSLQQLAVGVHAPVEAHVGAAVAFAVSVQMPVPRRSPSVSPSSRCGRSERTVLVRVCRWYGQAALEVLVRCTRRRRLDVDVDRLPPVAGTSCRRRARRRRPRAARRRPTRRRTRTRSSSSAGDPLLGLQARARGVAGGAELGDELRAGERASGSRSGCTPARRGARGTRRCGRSGSGGCGSGPASSPPGCCDVRRVGRDRDLVAGVQHVDLAVQLDLQHALDHRVALGHADVDVRDA